MRLSNLVPSIPPDVVASLECQGIRTDMDLLSATTVFDIYKRLPAGTATLEELTEYRRIAAEAGSAAGISGHELLLLEGMGQDNAVQLHTGILELDVFFRGFIDRRVVELSGDARSGKSTVALNLILRHLALQPNDTALWVDTTCSFSPDRARQIVQVSQILPSTLERLQISLAFDIETILGLLEAPALLGDTQSQLRFLVIDAVTPLLGPVLSAVSAQGHAIMVDFMRHLQDFAQNSGVTVLVINDSTRKGPDTHERKPALGPSFALLTDTTLWLSKGPDSSNGVSPHTIRILRSRSAPTGRCCSFLIHENVIGAKNFS